MGETYDLPRSEEEGCGAARGHHLERNTAFEIGRVLFPILEVGLVAVDEALDKGVILLLVHRAVDIILAVADRTDLVPAARHPCDVHVDEIGRAHVCTPVTNAHIVCRLLLEKKTTYIEPETIK